MVAQLVGDAGVRGALLDELHELAAFLRGRASHGGDLAALAASAPAALHSVPPGAVAAWLQARPA